MALFMRYPLVDGSASAFWDSRSAAAFICIFTVSILGIAAIFGRVYGKFKLTGTLHWDDLFMLLAGLSSVSYAITALLQIHSGLAIPMQERPYEMQRQFQSLNYTGRVFYLTGLTWFKGAIESVTPQIAILLQLMYGLIANYRYLDTSQRQHRRGWMYVTFATTFVSIMRVFTIAPATSIFSPESEALVIMGTLELNMGIISTSLPGWYMWMDVSRQGKRRFRDYEPFRSIRRLLLPLIDFVQVWVYRLYHSIITKIDDKTVIFEVKSSEDSGKEDGKKKPKKFRGLDIPSEEMLDEHDVLESLVTEQRQHFLTNRNYNILFTSDKTLTDMVRDEELEYIESSQWAAFNEQGIEFRLREQLTGGPNRYLDGLLFDEMNMGGRASRNPKGGDGLRQRK
ncbi:hypothetical protein TWF481_004365 [Arthrobotrys musiformis]|uniref:Uncharacterized protein n=1 Tax=Arthrobotrys musiformis TaxID=47236 RepID=A0AAV9WKW5_9PEZI